VQKAWDENDKIEDAISNRMGADPEPPEEMFRRNSDFLLFWGFSERLYPHRSGRLWYGSTDAIEYLRTHQFVRCVGPEGALRHDEAHDRAAEIVSAHDRWRAEIKAREDAAGLTAVQAQSERFRVRHSALLKEIVVTPAATLAEAIAKAQICLWCHGGSIDGSDLQLDDPTSSGSPSRWCATSWGSPRYDPARARSRGAIPLAANRSPFAAAGGQAAGGSQGMVP
jgi:hypothetical protein